MTKSTITREQLIGELKRRISVTERYPDLETAQIDAIICKMALAAMDSEPVAWQIHTPETGVTYVETNPQSVENIRNGFGIKVEIAPLYRHAQPALVVQDGYVLVPIEPTEAMCDISHIGVDVYCGITDDNEYYSIGGAEAAKVWKAMLAAAQQEVSHG